MWRSFGPAPLALVLAAGVIYSLGALVYAKKRPDPVPAAFGHHEVFHGLVVLAALHFVAVARVSCDRAQRLVAPASAIA